MARELLLSVNFLSKTMVDGQVCSITKFYKVEPNRLTSVPFICFLH